MAAKLIRVVPRRVTAEEGAKCDALLEECNKVQYDESAGPNPWLRPEAEVARAKYLRGMRDLGILCTAKQNGLAYFGIFTDAEWQRVRDVS